MCSSQRTCSTLRPKLWMLWSTPIVQIMLNLLDLTDMTSNSFGDFLLRSPGHKHGCNSVVLRVSQRSWHVEQVDISITKDDAAIGEHSATMQFLTCLCVKKW